MKFPQFTLYFQQTTFRFLVFIISYYKILRYYKIYFIISYYKILGIIPYAIKQDLLLICFTCHSLYLLIQNSQFTPPHLFPLVTLFSTTPQFKSINSLVLNFLSSLTPISIHDYCINHSFDQMAKFRFEKPQL